MNLIKAYKLNKFYKNFYKANYNYLVNYLLLLLYFCSLWMMKNITEQ